MMKKRMAGALFITVLVMIFSCRQQQPAPEVQRQDATVENNSKYINLIMALDTMTIAGANAVIQRQELQLSGSGDKAQDPFYYYFRGIRWFREKKTDSALTAFDKMNVTEADGDVYLLKQHALLDKRTGNSVVVPAADMNRIQVLMEQAESRKSKITYLFYDLLAKAYYQNRDEKISKKYAEQFYEHHPFKQHPKIKQRYFDISFLLSSRMGDYSKMEYFNAMARELAVSMNDSLAIARTYDNESQIYSLRGQYARALESSRVYFHYLERAERLNPVAYNNLATSFMRNGAPDSAIFYYKKGLDFFRKNGQLKVNPFYYKGLASAYEAKGNYVKALEMTDLAYGIEIDDIRKIEAVKMADLREKYEAEKKDIRISELNARNTLNGKVIRQQKWTLFSVSLVFAIAIAFLYNLYRQQKLKERNKVLGLENQRLRIEQKLLQAQLNPHFIFNAVANLQSLIASKHNDEAALYLSHFSQLLRLTLEQSRKDFITINDEIESLQHYMGLQQMRYPGLFQYHIHANKYTGWEQVFIPPMLVQPFVENAIEHGFRNINYTGILDIAFAIRKDQLHIIIDDNGCGLIEKGAADGKKQSLAQIILKERLDTLAKSLQQEAFYNISDKKNGMETGVRVQIVIPVITD
ncbi:tetratricopeptide repeat-containing sensor histidine kinase [Niabella sp. 22666]|uniref:tetratricopeptide repeat-containing sensor histidine kinase n=1 Tax=Niabella sp. 22666 TaxID=3453954 RepID=UPI003F85499E